MATNYYNVEMGVVDASGNLNVIYPVTTANNVAVGTNETLASRLNTLNSNINKKQNIINLSSSSDTYYRITSNRKPYEAIFSLGNVNLLIFGNSVMNGIFINDGGQHRWMVVSLRLGQQYYTSQDYSKTSFSFTSSGNGASVYISDGTIKTSASVKEYIYPLTTLIII